MLYLDIKDAFNAVNHRAIFYVFEAYGFPEKDVDFIRRMYSRSFHTIQNSFGGREADHEICHPAATASTHPAKTHPPTSVEPPTRAREAERERGRWEGRGSAAPDVERLHRREARQTGREGSGAVGTYVISTAGEREQMG
jgi:hypothetical protein